MRNVLLLCVVLLQWIHTDAGPVCFGLECVDGATCSTDPYVVCTCPADKPKGDAKFYCYAGSDRLVGMEFGDPYVTTLIPGEKYKVPLPCGHLALRGRLPGNCYLSVYANGVDLDSDVDLRNAFISSLEVIVKKGEDLDTALETRIHVEDGATFTKREIAVDAVVSNGVISISSTDCNFFLKYRNEKPFVIIDIPKSENAYEGSMLPSRELHQTLDQQAHEYNLTLQQEILYTVAHTIDSKFPECNDVSIAMSHCLDVASEDESTLICGQYVFTNEMTECLVAQSSPKKVLQDMGQCIRDICDLKKPPCEVITKHFTSCKANLKHALDKYNCNV